MNGITHFQFALTKEITANPSNELLFQFQPHKKIPCQLPPDTPSVNKLLITPLILKYYQKETLDKRNLKERKKKTYRH